MMGTILLLLLCPIVLWAISELLYRFSKAPVAWESMGFQLGPHEPVSEDEEASKIHRAPDLAPRLSLHERKPVAFEDDREARRFLA